jgi:hypothetical protein
LSKVASKTNEEWMARWVQEPRSFRHTRMPQLWGVRTADQQTDEVKARDGAEITRSCLPLDHRREIDAAPGDLDAPQDLRECRLPVAIAGRTARPRRLEMRLPQHG